MTNVFYGNVPETTFMGEAPKNLGTTFPMDDLLADENGDILLDENSEEILADDVYEFDPVWFFGDVPETVFMGEAP